MPYSGIKPSLVFFGSGPVAAVSLKLLLANFSVEAVITKPATQAEMTSIAQTIPVYTAGTKKDLDTLVKDKQFKSPFGVLIDFGIIVSQLVISSFEKGIINSHFSLLPEWRGADPISFTILSGQLKTGVSLMLIDKGLDTGKLIGQKSLPLAATETTPSLTQKLVTLSDEMLAQYLPRYFNGRIAPRRQPHPERATYSRKLTKADGKLNFTKPAAQLEREIRAFIDWPKSHTHLAGKDVVILNASLKKRSGEASIGTVYTTQDKKIGVHCRIDDLIIEELKPAGKKAMTSQAFLAGYGQQL